MKPVWKSTVTECTEQVPPALHGFITDVRESLLERIRWAAGRCRWRLQFSNFSRVYRAGLRWLQKEQWQVLRTDKDGGFAFVEQSSQTHACRRIIHAAS